MIRRTAFLLYGIVAYAAFLVTILYAIGFVGDLVVPRTIDRGPPTPVAAAIFIDCLLLALFAVSHSIMARPGFKSWWTKVVPVEIERSTFVLAASLALGLLFWQWRPLPAPVWHVEHAWGRVILWAIYFTGWALVFASSFVIDHFDLFGLRQVALFWKGRTYEHPRFKERSLYKLVRHPLMLGFLLAFWAAPTMTQGHLVFSIMTTAYILIAVQLEERDLLRFLGEDYRKYRQRTPMLIPFGRKNPRE